MAIPATPDPRNAGLSAAGQQEQDACQLAQLLDGVRGLTQPGCPSAGPAAGAGARSGYTQAVCREGWEPDSWVLPQVSLHDQGFVADPLPAPWGIGNPRVSTTFPGRKGPWQSRGSGSAPQAPDPDSFLQGMTPASGTCCGAAPCTYPVRNVPPTPSPRYLHDLLPQDASDHSAHGSHFGEAVAGRNQRVWSADATTMPTRKSSSPSRVAGQEGCSPR